MKRRVKKTARVQRLADTVRDEVLRAMGLHAPLNSTHEAYAVLLEEVDELWDEIKKRRALRDDDAMRTEAIQVAAMAMRLVLDTLPHADRGRQGQK